MVCFDTPNSRPTSAALLPASICFNAPIISTSLYFLFDMPPPSHKTRYSYTPLRGFWGAGHFVEHHEKMDQQVNGNKISKHHCRFPENDPSRNDAEDSEVHRIPNVAIESLYDEYLRCINRSRSAESLHSKIPSAPKINSNSSCERKISYESPAAEIPSIYTIAGLPKNQMRK